MATSITFWIGSGPDGNFHHFLNENILILNLSAYTQAKVSTQPYSHIPEMTLKKYIFVFAAQLSGYLSKETYLSIVYHCFGIDIKWK